MMKIKHEIFLLLNKVMNYFQFTHSQQWITQPSRAFCHIFKIEMLWYHSLAISGNVALAHNLHTHHSKYFSDKNFITLEQLSRINTREFTHSKIPTYNHVHKAQFKL